MGRVLLRARSSPFEIPRSPKAGSFGAVLNLVAAAALTAGCATPQLPDATPHVTERARLQRESLAFVFRAGAPLPPPPDRAELDALARKVAGADPEESTLLLELFGDQPDLLVYATRDSDGDGIHDFRVSDYYGKFLEGDVDLDGDGVRNVVDDAPYDPARGGQDTDDDGLPDPGTFLDENENGVPDDLDWGLDEDRSAAAEIQRSLFVDRRLLLVDRSARFDDRLARSVYDVVTRVLDAVPGPLPAALRVVAAEEECLLYPEEDTETHAMAISHTQTLVVYRSGIDLSGIAQLGLLLHELAHHHQFALDFGDLAEENRRVYFPAPNFLARMVPFGWTADPLPPEQRGDVPGLFAPHYVMTEPAYAWRGEAPEAWAAWLESIYGEVGDGYLRDPRVTELAIVGAYSLLNPFEWHSDSVLAYLFVEIENWIAHNPDSVRAVPQDLRRAAREAWPSFRYTNLAPEVREHFRRVLPLRDEDLAYFARRYVAPVAREP